MKKLLGIFVCMLILSGSAFAADIGSIKFVVDAPAGLEPEVMISCEGATEEFTVDLSKGDSYTKSMIKEVGVYNIGYVAVNSDSNHTTEYADSFKVEAGKETVYRVVIDGGKNGTLASEHKHSDGGFNEFGEVGDSVFATQAPGDGDKAITEEEALAILAGAKYEDIVANRPPTTDLPEDKLVEQTNKPVSTTPENVEPEIPQKKSSLFGGIVLAVIVIILLGGIFVYLRVRSRNN